jgi:hypothetical protein
MQSTQFLLILKVTNAVKFLLNCDIGSFLIMLNLNIKVKQFKLKYHGK